MTDPFDSLPARLWDASASSARFAISNYRDADPNVTLRAALSLGHAAEQLVMACVASIDPSLLAEGKSAYSRFALSRGNSSGLINIHSLRTVSWSEGYAILRQLDPRLGESRDLKSVMETRNGAAHIAIVDAEDLGYAVIKFTHVAGVLHGVLPEFEEDEYWGEAHLALVEGLRDERADAVRVGLDAKKLAASEYFKSLFLAVESAAREVLLVALEAQRSSLSRAHGDDGESVRHQCPVCDRSGYLHFSSGDQLDHEFVMDYDRDGVGSFFVTYSVEWLPIAFECPVCNLQLTDDEVAIIKGMESFIRPEQEPLGEDEAAAYLAEEEYDREMDAWD